MEWGWISTLPWLKIAYGVVAIIVTVILYKLIQNVEEEGDEEKNNSSELRKIESLPWNEFKSIDRKPKKNGTNGKSVKMEDVFYEAKEIKTDYGEKEYA